MPHNSNYWLKSFTPLTRDRPKPAPQPNARFYMRPFSAFIFIALLYPAVAFISDGKHSIGGLIAAASITLPATFMIGMPVFLFLKHRNWLSCKPLAVGGGSIGILCSLPVLSFAGHDHIKVILTCCCIGAAHGIIFWFLAIWRNKNITNTSTTKRQA